MALEAQGKKEQAMAIYQKMLDRDPNSLYALKRQVAILRAMGKPEAAAAKLTSHLDVVSSDVQSWLALSDIYLQLSQYRRAAFCIEELILLNPMAYIYHIRYGEILYTIGTSEKAPNPEMLKTARKYFCHALELKPTANLRALYGLLLCAAASKASAERAEIMTKTRAALVLEYEQANSPLIPTVKAMMSTLAS